MSSGSMNSSNIGTSRLRGSSGSSDLPPYFHGGGSGGAAAIAPASATTSVAPSAFQRPAFGAPLSVGVVTARGRVGMPTASGLGAAIRGGGVSVRGESNGQAPAFSNHHPNHNHAQMQPTPLYAAPPSSSVPSAAHASQQQALHHYQPQLSSYQTTQDRQSMHSMPPLSAPSSAQPSTSGASSSSSSVHVHLHLHTHASAASSDSSSANASSSLSAAGPNPSAAATALFLNTLAFGAHATGNTISANGTHSRAGDTASNATFRPLTPTIEPGAPTACDHGKSL